VVEGGDKGLVEGAHGLISDLVTLVLEVLDLPPARREVPHVVESLLEEDARADECRSLLFEEVTRTLLCSDLFSHEGDVEPVTESDVVDRAKRALTEGQKGPFANAYPYTPLTDPILQGLAGLRPIQLALMHGSSFVGDGERALRDLAAIMKEILGAQQSAYT
jgi:hypothetical protein